MSAPTLEYAAQVCYEGMNLIDLPDEVRAVLVRCDHSTAPRWCDLSETARAYWVRLMYECVCPFERFDDEPDPTERIHLGAPLSEQAEMFAEARS